MKLYLLIAYAVLNLGDAVLTYLALRSPNRKEGNEFLSRMFLTIGTLPTLALFKIIAIGMAVGAYYYVPSPYLELILGVGIIAYAGICINNFRML